MRTRGKISGLYFITDRKLSRKGIIEDAKAAVRGGAKIIQYREKEFPTREMIGEARELGGICRKNGVTFIVNDRVDVALACDADGVHVGTGDVDYETARKILGDEKIIGVTAASSGEAADFGRKGADYVAVSPVFITSTKKDAGKPVGTSEIREAKQKTNVPVVAIGGITRENLNEVLEAGADAVCMISAILNKKDVENEVREIRRAIDEHSA